jgi:hypothetical protein
MAAVHCTTEIFGPLLSYGADLNNAIPLHCAVGVPLTHFPDSRIPMLEYLLGLGVDINSMHHYLSIRKGTPLDAALIWKRFEEARWLQDSGAKEGRLIRGGLPRRDTT